MIIVLSPAKTLDYEFESNHDHSVPAFLSQSSKLINNLKTKEPKDIATLMGLSDKLATLNFDRYQSWSPAKKVSADSKPSMLVFKGDVYQGLQAEDRRRVPRRQQLARAERFRAAGLRRGQPCVVACSTAYVAAGRPPVKR